MSKSESGPGQGVNEWLAKKIPPREAWLFESADGLERVLKGLSDARAGKTWVRGNFVPFIDDNAKEPHR